MDAKRPPSILVADDNESTLVATVRFLRGEHYEVVGAVQDGTALVKAVMRFAPDVAVVDISMPEVSGLDATAQLQTMNCNTKVVILTVHRDPEILRAAFAAGATGYVLKHRLAKDLPRAIELALQGERFVSPPLMDHPA